MQVKGVRMQQLYACAAVRRGQLRSDGMQGMPAACLNFRSYNVVVEAVYLMILLRSRQR